MKDNPTKLKDLFDGWGRTAGGRFAGRQWLLSKWEVIDGIEWPPEKVRLLMDSIRQGLGIHDGLSLVDLGCGGGWILKALSGLGVRAVGVDFSLPMLENAVHVGPGGALLCGDITKLPLKDGRFDRALSYFVFHNFLSDEDVYRGLEEVGRILAPGGRALIGQLPDRDGSADYDAAKEAYLAHCRRSFKAGTDYRDIYRIPQKLFDRRRIEEFLREKGFKTECRRSFNPFYRKGEPEAVDWRFDLVFEKKG